MKTETSTDPLANIDTDDSLNLYLRVVSQIPLLSAEQEVNLAIKMDQGRQVREKLARHQSNHSAPRPELIKLIEVGQTAQEYLIIANSRLVIDVAKTYLGRGLPFLDLIQEGNLGLIRATKKFDYRLGFRFSTYVKWGILQAIGLAVADKSRIIRVPFHTGEDIMKLFWAKHQLTQALGRKPSIEELAQDLRKTKERITELLKIHLPLSLDEPIDGKNDSVFGDFLEDDSTPSLEKATFDKIFREDLQKSLTGLRPRQSLVLKLRYGMFDGQCYSQEEVGKKLGISRERARQIEAEALSHLRKPSINRKLRDYLDQ